MSVWLTIPSARPAREAEKCLALWRERGYKIALWVDSVADGQLKRADYYISGGRYPGYSAAVNALISDIMGREDSGRLEPVDAAAEWFVVAGDDIEPDLNHTADEIAEQCAKHFQDLAWPLCWHWPAGKTLEQAAADGSAHQEKQALWSADLANRARTTGVMQPTGDRWGDDAWSRNKWPNAPAYIDRVLGSAWYGREYCRRMYGGRGPLFEGYTHMFEDEEAQNVALKMGVLWQRRDLTQKHNHWGRKPNATEEDCPEFLRKVNGMTPEGRKHWADSQLLFETRRDAGFPGHEPIP